MVEAFKLVGSDCDLEERLGVTRGVGSVCDKSEDGSTATEKMRPTGDNTSRKAGRQQAAARWKRTLGCGGTHRCRR